MTEYKQDSIIMTVKRTAQTNTAGGSQMVGKNYNSITTKLVMNGSWRILDTESGWSRLVKYERHSTRVLELDYDSSNIITNVYGYSYEA